MLHRDGTRASTALFLTSEVVVRAANAPQRRSAPGSNALRIQQMCLWNLLLFVGFVASNKYNISVIRHEDTCLGGNRTTKPRMLEYYDGSKHAVRIPYPNWASARISSEIAYSILDETMQYSTEILDTKTILSAHVVNYVAGCLDPDDINCVERNVDNPQAPGVVA